MQALARFREYLRKTKNAPKDSEAASGVADAEGLTKSKAFVVLKPGALAGDAELKAFAEKWLPTMQGHVQEIQQAEDAMKKTK